MSDKKTPGKVQFWKPLTKAEQRALRGGKRGRGGDSTSNSASGTPIGWPWGKP